MKVFEYNLNRVSWACITPPVVFFLNTTSGFDLFNLIPIASSSSSRSRFCSSDLVASRTTTMRSAVLAAGIQIMRLEAISRGSD